MGAAKTMPSRKSDRRGVSLLLVAAMTVVIFPMVGLSVDAGILYVVKTKLSAAVDSAALEGGKALRRGSDTVTQEKNAKDAATNYFRANFPTGSMLTTDSKVSTTVAQLNGNVRQVVVNATADVPLAFLRMLPNVGSTLTVAASATAQRRDTNLMLVLDRSGSLFNSGSCDPMKAAAAGFVDMFSEQRDYLGLATFGTSAFYLDYNLVTNFKSTKPKLADIIGTISCDGATSSAMGLWNAYTALVDLAQPGSLNVIVFFTDGQPTALAAKFPILAGSSCGLNKPPYPPNQPKTGVLTVTYRNGVPDQPFGLFPLSVSAMPVDERKVLSNDRTCAFSAKTPTAVDSDIQYVPTLDYFGDKTDSGYQAVSAVAGGIAADPTSIQNASINAADQAARHIRNGDPITAVVTGAPAGAVGKSLSNVIIFSIGLANSTDPPKADFLKRVANDPGSDIFDSSKAPGLYVEAKTASDLDVAFKRIASEVLKLAR
jgi:Flp pilus assembly protein TadG